ncbi:expressed unknown protein [Seminavis robusta]|uniref:PDZ domain-containing protein n=1 Tax=Seminavis robusta TaxID=568900 RepID=A0A9N8DW19_9STRA|nr:expressed unknown protein [Seminavis robusta]|eukprot:Sro289_g109150.1 n/a (1570) ;mRNA; r:52463-57380
MVDTKPSGETDTSSNISQPIGRQQTVAENQRVGGDNDGGNDEDSNDDEASVDLLKTQDEWSDQDDEEDDEEDDDFFDLKPKSSPSTNARGDGLIVASALSPPSFHDSTHKSNNAETCRAVAADSRSPATRTIDRLSEQSSQSNLLYDKTNMDRDAASVMIQLSQTESMSSAKESPHRPRCSNGRDAATKTNTATKSSTAVGAASPLPPPQPEPKTCSDSATGSPQRKQQQKTKVQFPAPNERSNVQTEQHLREKQVMTKPVQHKTAATKSQQHQQGDTTTNTASTAKAAPPFPGELTDLANYEIQHYNIAVHGRVGVIIHNTSELPADLITGAKNWRYPQIKEVNPGSIAYEHGLRTGDWFLADSKAESLGSYATIVNQAKSKKRPLIWYVARRKDDSRQQGVGTLDDEIARVVDQVVNRPEDEERLVPLIEARTVAHQNPTAGVATVPTPKGTIPKPNDIPQKPKSTKTVRRKTTNKPTKTGREGTTKANLWDSDTSSDEEDPDKIRAPLVILPNHDKVVPFCKLCKMLQQKKRKKPSSRSVHHALCPRNDFFEDSKADCILQDLITGVKLDCSACKKSYQVGKVEKGESHVASCPFHKSKVTPGAKEAKSNISRAKNASLGVTDETKGKDERTTDQKKEKTKKEPKRAKSTNPPKRGSTTAVANHATAKSSPPTIETSRQDAATSAPTLTPPNLSQQPKRHTPAAAGPAARPSPNASETAGDKRNPPPPQASQPQAPVVAKKATQVPAVAKKTTASTKKAANKKKASTTNTTTADHVVSPSNGGSACRQEHPRNEGGSAMLMCAALENPLGRNLGHSHSQPMQRQGQHAATAATAMAALHPGKLTDYPKANGTSKEVTAAHRTPTSFGVSRASTTSASASSVSGNPPSNKDQRTSREDASDKSGRNQIEWIHHENPWGPAGFQLGDVAIFTQRRGIGHHESMLPSERFVSEPFSADTNYHKTHRTPEEGYQYIRLQRDDRAQRSWGFTVRRHDFGGACLVERVDPMSPAESAVFVGMSASGISAALSVNDMLVAINEKPVGGMSVEGVNIELEVAGPTMLLVVSRYRFTEHLKDSIVEVEENVVAAIDEAFNDERSLAWVDGNGTTATQSGTPLSTMASKVLNNLLVSRPVNGTAEAATVSPSNDTSSRATEGETRDHVVESHFETPQNNDPQSEGSLEEMRQADCGDGLDTVSCYGKVGRDSVQASHDETVAISMDIDTTPPATKAYDVRKPCPLVRMETSEARDDTQGSPPKKAARFFTHLPDKQNGSKKIGDGRSTLRVPAAHAELQESFGDDMQEEDRSPSAAQDKGGKSAPLAATAEPGEKEQQTSAAQGEIAALAALPVSRPSPMDEEQQQNDSDDNKEDVAAKESACRDGIDNEEDSATDEEEDDDGNPALGCVCGDIHDKRCVVFWVQCDSCDAWYNVSRRCVGFNEEQAQKRNWSCWACCSSDEEDDEEPRDCEEARKVSLNSDSDDSDQSSSLASPKIARKQKRRRASLPTKCDPRKRLPNGTTVEVDREGSHKFGGFGQIKDSYLDEDGIWRYSVSYTIHRYTENDISAEYVMIQN